MNSELYGREKAIFTLMMIFFLKPKFLVCPRLIDAITCRFPYGLVKRTVYAEVLLPKVDYKLTENAQELVPIWSQLSD
ncbi:hypothetical protein BAX95_08140 [Elizabethkingia meningoseptica]|nr:hypothetical protein AYC67_16920 [Elizabethkingia anophelis]OPB57388.1 hypothetical protein BAY10_10345 [Elizabethkingia anophelis]OPC20354.1 hypothetical protein BAX95_08140 [Elizabethkingia meningoseptica]OPC57737.1 hypothetical protein BAY08_02795 [Elizabethkingia anophelis]WMC06092.1 MAG: hypothetical protein PQ275_07110 [Elizabethkingia anophelis]